MKTDLITFGINGSQYLLVALQVNEIFQYVELGLAIFSTIFLLIYRIWKWVKEAKKDGTIDSDEIEELIHIVGEESENISKQVKDNKKDDTK